MEVEAKFAGGPKLINHHPGSRYSDGPLAHSPDHHIHCVIEKNPHCVIILCIIPRRVHLDGWIVRVTIHDPDGGIPVSS
jgi:hypothetical protein